MNIKEKQPKLESNLIFQNNILLLPHDIWITIINLLLGNHESSDNLLSVVSVCKILNNIINLHIRPIYVPFDIFIPLKNIIGKWTVYEFDIPQHLNPNKYLKHLYYNCEISVKHYLYSPKKEFCESNIPNKGLLYLFVDIHNSFFSSDCGYKALPSPDEKLSEIKLMYLHLKKTFPKSKGLENLIKFIVRPLDTIIIHEDQEDGDYDTIFNFRCCLGNIPKVIMDYSQSSDSSLSGDCSLDF